MYLKEPTLNNFNTRLKVKSLRKYSYEVRVFTSKFVLLNIFEPRGENLGERKTSKVTYDTNNNE